MIDSVDTRDPAAVEREVRAIHLALFADADPAFVPRAFEWATACFCGDLRDYQPIDVGYHDLEHTLQGTLCLARLLRGRHRTAAEPRLTQRAFELGVLAALLHDTGYLKRRGDRDGTGAKYTVVHETRSATFACDLLAPKGFSDAEVRAVQNMIRCTGLETDLRTIPFRDELERTVGYALGTADLLGQMAAPDYVEKLPRLYDEFAEAVRHGGADASRRYSFESADALMRNTPAFWERYARPKLDTHFGGLHAFLADPYPGGPNPYVQRIEANLARVAATRPSRAP
jgi:hypothetical protein